MPDTPKTHPLAASIFAGVRKEFRRADELLNGDVCDNCGSCGDDPLHHCPDCPFRRTWEEITAAEARLAEIAPVLEDALQSCLQYIPADDPDVGLLVQQALALLRPSPAPGGKEGEK